MIITKTPFRVSFVGGGTDLAAFSTREYGAVVSTAIDKYVYIALHKNFSNEIQLKYSKTENVDSVDKIQHPLIREGMKITKCDEKIELTSFADIPSKGSGLGSSSSFCVGLVKALHALKGRQLSSEEAADLACQIEIDRLREPIGKQDQYAAAYGGFNYIRFNKDGTVLVEPILLSGEQRAIIEDHLIMFHTGITRKASDVLTEQQKNTSTDVDKFKALVKMRDLADEMRDRLNKGDIKCIGELLHKNWELKRDLASNLTNPQIDEWYERGLQAGAIGGKLLGAGGGGFILFWCPKQKQESLKAALQELKPVTIKTEPHGSRVIYYD